MNYVILRKFLSGRDCSSLISSTKYFDDSRGLPFIDNDQCNKWHTSNRSMGLEYRYQNDAMTMSLASGIKKELSSIVPIDFSGGINELCLPFCKYSDGGIIKSHRDIDKVGNNPVEYIVVCMLTQVGEDFHPNSKDYDSDNLFINFNPMFVSSDGKIVTERLSNTLKDRIYPNLNRGDIIIFRNDNSIHGVDPITVLEGQVGRITCGFRSK